MGIDRVSDNEYATVRADVLSCALVASKPRSLKGLRAVANRWVRGEMRWRRWATGVIEERSTEERLQDCFLRVHAVFGLVEDHRLRSIENFGGNFRAAVRRKTVHEHGIR